MAPDMPLLQKAILAREWSFNVAFDNFDPEAKQLVEQLMAGQAKMRIRAEVALYNPWIRRRWKPPPHGGKTLVALEKFCNSSRPKKLFGRFLVKFLDPEHLRVIADCFYSLDQQGDGAIDAKDLRMAVKFTDRSLNCVNTIVDWMCADGRVEISLTRFAESMAEEVIDGKALRHSFESLDDDGSEAISADELFDELSVLDKDLTMEEVLAHIKLADLGISEDVEGDEGESDNKLSFGEYIRLFPGRIARVRDIEMRIKNTRVYASEKHELYDSFKDVIFTWTKALDSEATAITKACGLLEKEPTPAVKELKRRLTKVAQLLAHPPGPMDLNKQMAVFNAAQKAAKKDAKGKAGGGSSKHAAAEEYGFDSFVQDHAIHSYWPVLIDGDRKMLRHATHTDVATGQMNVDYYKANDAGQNVVKKIDEVLEWTRGQLDEYGSFTQVMNDTEELVPGMSFSGRGLQAHGEEADNDGDGKPDVAGDDDDGAGNEGFLSRVSRMLGKK